MRTKMDQTCGSSKAKCLALISTPSGIWSRRHRNAGFNASQEVCQPGSDFRPNSSHFFLFRSEINLRCASDLRFTAYVHQDSSSSKSVSLWDGERLCRDIWTPLALASASVSLSRSASLQHI